MEVIKGNAFICKVEPHGNTSCIIHLFSKENGVITGYLKGATTSPLKRNICKLGNFTEFTWKARVLSQLGTLELSCIDNFSTVFTLVKYSIVNTVCEMLIVLLQKNDPHPDIFEKTLDLFYFLKTNNNDNISVLKKYVWFEIDLMSSLGFGYNFKECNISGSIPEFISPKTGNVVSKDIAKGYEDKLFRIPLFVLNENYIPSLDDLKKMLDINLHFLKLHLDINHITVRNFMLNLF